MKIKPNSELVLDNPFLELSKMLGLEDARLTQIISPYDFVFKYTYTLDPHDSVNPVKKIPEKEYIKHLIDLWMREYLLLIVKSRQMIVTWTIVALNLWLAMTQNGQYIFFVSKKEDDAGFSSDLSLLSRAMFIYNHLPKEMQIRYKKSSKPPILTFPNKNSTIHAVSQDSDAVRQYTASSLFADEMAFQERSEQVFASVKPTLDGRKSKIKIGDSYIALPKFTGVSTPNGKMNLFYKLVHDVQE